MAKWEIVSEFLSPGYALYAPDGSRVGTYGSMDEARSVMRELQETLAGLESLCLCTWKSATPHPDCPQHGAQA